MNSGGGAAAISRKEQGVGACVEPVVIGFVDRMVRGAVVGIQSGEAGFGRLSNARFGRSFGVNVRTSSLASQLPQVFVSFSMLGTPQNIVGAGLPAMGPVQTPQLSQTQQKAHQSVGSLYSADDDQNSFIFGASSFTGSFCAVCEFQPPPRALYRLTALVSCARRSVISACCALNS
jgi:hypothetical protein